MSKRIKLKVNPPVIKTGKPISSTIAFHKMVKYRRLLQRMQSVEERFRAISRYHWNYLNHVRLNANNIHIHIQNLETYKKEIAIYLRQVKLFNKFIYAHNIVEEKIQSPFNDEMEENGRYILGSLYDHLNN